MIGIYDNNIPPQLSHDSSFNNEPESMYKTCPECEGALDYVNPFGGGCLKCGGSGRIEMDGDEIRDYLDEKNERDDL